MIKLIDLLFYGINLAALVLLIAYLFRRFLKDSLQQMMTFEQLSYTNMLKRQEQLRKQEQHLIRAYYHQNYVYEELSQKVSLWRQRMSQHEAHYETACNVIDERIRVRQQQQRDYMHMLQVCREAGPHARKKAQEELLHYFENSPERRAAYIQQGLTALVKDAS